MAAIAVSGHLSNLETALFALNNLRLLVQDLVLFNDTIYYNIQYGRLDATREEVEDAARQVRCLTVPLSTVLDFWSSKLRKHTVPVGGLQLLIAYCPPLAGGHPRPDPAAPDCIVLAIAAQLSTCTFVPCTLHAGGHPRPDSAAPRRLRSCIVVAANLTVTSQYHQPLAGGHPRPDSAVPRRLRHACGRARPEAQVRLHACGWCTLLAAQQRRQGCRSQRCGGLELAVHCKAAYGTS